MDEILMRRGNTCYKTTEVTDWNSARQQCWNWGGELAFLLPGNDPECRAPVPGLQHEEVILRDSNQFLCAKKDSFIVLVGWYEKLFWGEMSNSLQRSIIWSRRIWQFFGYLFCLHGYWFQYFSQRTLCSTGSHVSAYTFTTLREMPEKIPRRWWMAFS